MFGKNVLITGGTGFIGSSIAERVVADNIILYDNLTKNVLKDKPELKDRSILVRGNILDKNLLIKTIKKYNITHVVHCAAIAGVDNVLSSPVDTIKINTIGTSTLLEALLFAEKIEDVEIRVPNLGNVERIVNFSTSEVFGKQAYRSDVDKISADFHVKEARWVYAISKIAGEYFSNAYYSQYGLPIVTVRPFNIYGPKSGKVIVVDNFIKRAIKNEDILITGDGSQIRAFCYIDDMVDATIKALNVDGINGETFNIGNPRSVVTIYDLAKKIISLSGSSSKIRFVEKIEDVEIRVPNIEKAQSLLGYHPKVELDEGLLKTIKWYRSL